MLASVLSCAIRLSLFIAKFDCVLRRRLRLVRACDEAKAVDDRGVVLRLLV
jgi:hypothetical protein